MLRITVRQNVNAVGLKLEGKLVGEWVHELRGAWETARRKGQAVVVSLTSVSSVDDAGWHLLTEIHAEGGVLTGTGLLARSMIQDITGIAS